MKSVFDEQAPPGFFGHRNAFRKDGFYGKWLLEKPLMIVINVTAFVHGGVPPYVAEHGLAGVNGTLKKDLLNFVVARSILEDAGILSPIDRFRDQPSILADKMQAEQLDDALMAAAQVVVDHRKSPRPGPSRQQSSKKQRLMPPNRSSRSKKYLMPTRAKSAKNSRKPNAVLLGEVHAYLGVAALHLVVHCFTDVVEEAAAAGDGAVEPELVGDHLAEE